MIAKSQSYLAEEQRALHSMCVNKSFVPLKLCIKYFFFFLQLKDIVLLISIKIKKAS